MNILIFHFYQKLSQTKEMKIQMQKLLLKLLLEQCLLLAHHLYFSNLKILKRLSFYLNNALPSIVNNSKNEIASPLCISLNSFSYSDNLSIKLLSQRNKT
jgi:hypothetical protein